MKRYIIFVILACLFFSSCQTVNNILADSDRNILDVFKGNGSYNPNDPFPKKGYTLHGYQYWNIEINKFVDNDTMFYIKYNPKREERNFYFTYINKETAELIISNMLDKEKHSDSKERKKWFDEVMTKLNINDITSKSSLWTYFSPKRKMVRGNLPTDRVRTGYHYEYEKFNYNTATEAFYKQRNPQHKYTGMEIIGALYVMNLLTNNKAKENEYRTQWDMYSDSQKAVIHEHDNAK